MGLILMCFTASLGLSVGIALLVDRLTRSARLVAFTGSVLAVGGFAVSSWLLRGGLGAGAIGLGASLAMYLVRRVLYGGWFAVGRSDGDGDAT